MSNVSEEDHLRLQLRQAEETLRALMDDVREAAKNLDHKVEYLSLCEGGASESLRMICDDLMDARDRAKAAWAKWKREDVR